MKILHIDTGKEWRGGQRQVFYLHKGLLDRGYKSYLAANIKGKLVKKVKDAIPYKFYGELSIRSVLNLKKIIDEIQPDIVHTHDAHALTPAVILKFLGFEYKLIYTRRVDFKIKKTFFNKIKYSNKIDKFVVISDAIRKIFLDFNVKNEKLKLIYSGIEKVKVEEYKCPLSKKRGTFFIGCVANFASHKDHFTLLKSFEYIYKKSKSVFLILVGDGPLFDEVYKFARTLKCFPNIKFLGFKEQIYDYYKCFDLFVITSKKEGLCTSVLDAFQFGLPVVSTNAGGLKEIVIDGVNGFVCDVGDYECIAEKIISLIDSKQLYDEFAKNAYKLFPKYEIDNMINQYIELYKGVLHV